MLQRSFKGDDCTDEYQSGEIGVGEILGLEEECWRRSFEEPPDIAKLAQEVAVMCDGLPLGLVAEPCHPRKHHRSGATLYIILNKYPPHFSGLNFLNSSKFLY